MSFLQEVKEQKYNREQGYGQTMTSSNWDPSHGDEAIWDTINDTVIDKNLA